jgi:hypothetical protein
VPQVCTAEVGTTIPSRWLPVTGRTDSDALLQAGDRPGELRITGQSLPTAAAAIAVTVAGSVVAVPS